MVFMLAYVSFKEILMPIRIYFLSDTIATIMLSLCHSLVLRNMPQHWATANIFIGHLQCVIGIYFLTQMMRSIDNSSVNKTISFL